MQALVLGLGNALLSDEGVGIHVLRALAAALVDEPTLREKVTLQDGGTLSFTLAGPIAAADALIVVDAANFGAMPGTWALLEAEAMDALLLGQRTSSVHEVGLSDLRDIAMLTGNWPARRVLLAIQPQRVDWGVHLTPAVASAIPAATAAILARLRSWG